MKVYAVIEKWENRENYEDYAHTETLIGLASTPEIAERLISERRKELIDIAKKANANEDPDTFFDVRWEEITDSTDQGLLFMHGVDSPFQTYSFHNDYFYWGIQEKELVME